MKKTIPLICLALFTQSAFAQDWGALSKLKKQLLSSRPDTGRINTLLKLAEFETFKPGEYKADLDSAADYIQQAKTLNQSIKSSEATGYITIEESYLARDRGDSKTGKILMEKAIDQLSGTENKYLLGTSYVGLSEYLDCRAIDEKPLRIKNLIQAAAVFHSGGFIEQEAFCYKNLADISEGPDILKFALRALKLYKGIHYKNMQGLYDILGCYYWDFHSFKNALYYLLLALKTAQNLHDTSGNLCEIQNHIGILYYSLKDYAQANPYFKMALQTARLNKDLQATVLVTLNLCNDYLFLNQPLKAKEAFEAIPKSYVSNPGSVTASLNYLQQALRIYTTLKDFDHAAVINKKIMKLLDKLDNQQSFKFRLYSDLLNYSFAAKHLGDVKILLLHMDSLGKRYPSVDYLINSNDYWFRLDTAQHDYRSAVYYAIKRQKLTDSLNQVNKSREIQSLQVQYDTKVKESQIILLNQKNKLEQANLKRADLIRNITVGFIFLTVLIIVLLYKQNRHKQKNNKKLESLVTEKEWLLKEVHHRVKNNLHTIICLLESQADYLKDDALKAIENSQHRIYAMSLIHQKLYQSEDIKVIDMKGYLTEFIAYLREGFGSPENIDIILNMEEIELDVSQAIPVGLILNEAINNAFKYAFPKIRKGNIDVSLIQTGNRITLVMSDNGVGIQQELTAEPGSLGMELMHGLAKDLKGNIRFENNLGTRITLEFVINTVCFKHIAA
jgi:two-component sensor histidine kinase